MAACVPSLRMIAVRLPEDDTLWWRIQRGEGETKQNLVRISGDAGRRVEAYLHSGEYERSLTFDGKYYVSTRYISTHVDAYFTDTLFDGLK